MKIVIEAHMQRADLMPSWNAGPLVSYVDLTIRLDDLPPREHGIVTVEGSPTRNGVRREASSDHRRGNLTVRKVGRTHVGIRETTTMVHIRKHGKNSRETECGAPATWDDVRASAWLLPFEKCSDCTETIRVRMARMLANRQQN